MEYEKVYSEMSAYHSADAMKYCDKLMENSKKRASGNRKFKKDPDFDEYRILRETVEGARRENIHLRQAASPATPALGRHRPPARQPTGAGPVRTTT